MAERLAIALDFTIVGRERYRRYFSQFSAIKFIPYGIGVQFEDNLYRVQRNSVIVDFLNNHHQGLSFRIFEALRFNKKLVTTNTTVKNYDFYHPHNIFIWDGGDLSGLADFIRLPYHDVLKEIKEKYSFSQWIRSILN